MPNNSRGLYIDIETNPNNGYSFYRAEHLYAIQGIYNNLLSEILIGKNQQPVQLHFDFYNERHHKPKKRKRVNPSWEYLCPF